MEEQKTLQWSVGPAIGAHQDTTNEFYFVAKRAMDLIVVVLSLVFLLPLMAFMALLIKWDSPGPAIFRQERVTARRRVHNGQVVWEETPFTIYKFRTMRTDAEALGPQITVGQDPRITRAGAWLRRAKMDELPQFLNVLRGDMSVVGPRPEVPRYVALYPSDVRETVLSVRPGITDLASIEFRNESELLAHSSDPERTYVEQILPAKLHHAQQYVRTRSLWLDLRLIAWTALAILGLHAARRPDRADNP